MKTALGAKATDATMVIENEARRDALLLLLEESIKAYEGEGKDVL
jgi:hypothetical protein